MRVRLVAAVVAALMLVPTSGVACTLACLSNASTATGAHSSPDPHAHHRAGAIGSAALQATHGCDHDARVELVVATATRTGATVAFAPVTPATTRMGATARVAIPWSGTRGDRAAPPGVTASLLHLRI